MREGETSLQQIFALWKRHWFEIVPACGMLLSIFTNCNEGDLIKFWTMTNWLLKEIGLLVSMIDVGIKFSCTLNEIQNFKVKSKLEDRRNIGWMELRLLYALVTILLLIKCTCLDSLPTSYTLFCDIARGKIFFCYVNTGPMWLYGFLAFLQLLDHCILAFPLSKDIFQLLRSFKDNLVIHFS